MSTSDFEPIDVPSGDETVPAAAPVFEIGSDGVGCVVVGYDGTVPSRDALAFAAGTARRGAGRVIVVFVNAPLALGGLSAAGSAMVEAGDEEAAVLRRGVEPALTDLGVRAEFVTRRGEPAREIEAVAQEQRADLIVVGRSSSRTHALLGSVAVQLVKHARRPITVVP